MSHFNLIIYCKEQITLPSGISVPKVLVNSYDEYEMAKAAQKEINEFGTLNSKFGYTEQKYVYADLQYDA